MASRPGNKQSIPPNTPDLIDWITGEQKTRSRRFVLLRHNLKELSYRFSGFSLPLFVSFIIGIFAILAIEIEVLAPFLLTVLVLVASVGAITTSLTVWRVGRWLRIHFRNHWQHQIPMHNLEVTGFSRDTFSEVHNYVTYRLQIDDHYNAETRPSSSSLYVGIWLLFLGYTTQLTSILFLVVAGGTEYSNKFNKVTVGMDVSTPAAFLSALLGPLIGAITISIASISNSLSDFVLVVFLFVLPAYFIAPGVQNLIEWSETMHREWADYFAAATEPAQTEKNGRIILLGLMYLLIDVWIAYSVIRGMV